MTTTTLRHWQHSRRDLNSDSGLAPGGIPGPLARVRNVASDSRAGRRERGRLLADPGPAKAPFRPPRTPSAPVSSLLGSDVRQPGHVSRGELRVSGRETRIEPDRAIQQRDGSPAISVGGSDAEISRAEHSVVRHRVDRAQFGQTRLLRSGEPGSYLIGDRGRASRWSVRTSCRSRSYVSDQIGRSEAGSIKFAIIRAKHGALTGWSAARSTGHRSEAGSHKRTMACWSGSVPGLRQEQTTPSCHQSQ
jgi:hypothetical protein